jgi:tetratricopeptide (TPR) repeat protein
LRIVYLLAPIAMAFTCMSSQAQQTSVAAAIAAFERGDLDSAERELRSDLRRHPYDADALTVLGIVLDQEKKLEEADAVYKRALALAPNSPSLLNNYGNHLLSLGKFGDARAAYERVLKLNRADVNACKQVVRIGLRQKSAVAAACLDHVPSSSENDPEILLLRMETDFALGRKTAASGILERLTSLCQTDATLSFQVGEALASVREYDKAEDFFSRSLQLTPGKFETLYDLGLAAAHAGHKQLAADTLTRALDLQPGNAGVMYDLAVVDVDLGRKEPALELLARAARLAPDRAEIHRLIAYTSAELGDFGDAVEAWDRYLKLVPGDATAQRERVFALSALGDSAQSALGELRSYIRAHPNDAIGHYELGTAETTVDPNDAVRELTRALDIKPDLTFAHIARGLIRYRAGDAGSALTDFEAAAREQPANPRILDRLGEIYAALNRPGDALRAFQKAAELAPRDSSILLHLGRALATSGQTEQAQLIFARFRELGPNKSALPHPPGLVDFLALSPEEQYQRYRAGVERSVERNPENPESQVRYLGILLNDHDLHGSAEAARKILDLKPSSDLLLDAANELLNAEQYSLASDFLKRAVQISPGIDSLKLDNALAIFHCGDPREALAKLDAIPNDNRKGDYFLARMQILTALNETAEAKDAFERGTADSPVHPELYRQVALTLIKQQRYSDAERLLKLGTRMLPNDADLPFLRTVLAESGTKADELRTFLNDFAAQWPESKRLWSAIQ